MWIQIILIFAMYLGVETKVWKFKKEFEQEFLAQKCRSLELMCGVFLIWGRSNVYIKLPIFSLFFVHP